MILLDSNIVIEVINHNAEALSLIQQWPSDKTFISIISEWEVLAGAKSKPNQTQFLKALNRYNVIHLDKEISKLTGILLKTYRLGHSLSIPDALIAATAIRYKIPLLTLNVKYFQFIQGLEWRTMST